MKKDKQITVWGKPTEEFLSGYGEVNYYDWCLKEQKRFASHGKQVKIINGKGTHKGKIALARAG